MRFIWSRICPVLNSHRKKSHSTNLLTFWNVKSNKFNNYRSILFSGMHMINNAGFSSALNLMGKAHKSSSWKQNGFEPLITCCFKAFGFRLMELYPLKRGVGHIFQFSNNALILQYRYIINMSNKQSYLVLVKSGRKHMQEKI